MWINKTTLTTVPANNRWYTSILTKTKLYQRAKPSQFDASHDSCSCSRIGSRPDHIFFRTRRCLKGLEINRLSLGSCSCGGFGALESIGSSGHRSVSLMKAPDLGDASDGPVGQLGHAQLVLRVCCSNELSWLVRQKANKFVAVRQTDFL